MAAPSPSLTPEQVQATFQALLNGPATAPPVGMMSNLKNPANLDGTIIPVMAVCLTVSTLALLVRMCTKLFLLRSMAYEDYTIALAWVGQVGFIVPSVWNFKSGGGTHMWDIRLKDFFRLLYWFNISAITYAIIVCLIKESILLQYLRIFVPNRKGNMILYVAIQILMWSNFLFYLVDTIFKIVMCIPREKIWNPLMTSGYCFDANALYEASGVFNVISDFSLLVLPMVPIWRLQTPVKRKMMMIAIFATGIGACITSILRTYYTFKIVQSPDKSYNLIITGLWTWGEITAGIVISCLPIMPKFFQELSIKISGAFSKSNSNLVPKSKFPDIKNKAGVSVPFRRPCNRHDGSSGQLETWNDSCGQQTHHKGDYITLSELDELNPRDTVTVRQSSILGAREGLPTRREDLETGRSVIQGRV